MKLPTHKTKIVCTIGPASRSRPMLETLIKRGMNVARLNLSHGTHEEHRETIRRIQSAAGAARRAVTILIDLPGPKIRIGKLRHEPLMLEKGRRLILTTEDVPGTDALIGVNYKKLPQSVRAGNVIYLNDGFIQLKVLSVGKTQVQCRVVIGGPLLSHKGINLPKAKLSLETVTAQDLEHLEFGLDEGVDTFGISFVEKADDIHKARKFAAGRGRSINVVAKIERAEALKNIDAILQTADAVMVARGDLGVQIPLENVPGVQKQLIMKANMLGRPVITATQMLESMTENIRPTRAEVTDVANAILDGTDAVMLSEETAIGKYPAESVHMMSRIAASIERRRSALGRPGEAEDLFRTGPGGVHPSIEDVISLNVIEASRALKARFIIAPTESGNTPRCISRFKPPCWVLSPSGNERTLRLLAFSYGVHPYVLHDEVPDETRLIASIRDGMGLIKKGDTVIVARTASPGHAGGKDSFRIITVP